MRSQHRKQNVRRGIVEAKFLLMSFSVSCIDSLEPRYAIKICFDIVKFFQKVELLPVLLFILLSQVDTLFANARA